MPMRNATAALLLLTGTFAPIVLLAQSNGDKQPPERTTEPAAAKLLRTDSPTPYVHRLTLYDHTGQAIDPSDPDAKPYSPKMTCGKCHPYAEIAKGWHFNPVGSSDVSSARNARGDETTERRSDGAPEGSIGVPPVGSADVSSASTAPVISPAHGAESVQSDRPGEPWIYADARLGVQIPLSPRGWPHGFVPANIGLTAWQFTLHFGRHLCGGGFVDPSDSDLNATAEPTRQFDPPTQTEKKRWAISGGLEIDCMMCHASMASGYDAGEVERQVERQNLRWSATAALGLGLIRGDARSVSNEYDPENPAPPDRADLQLPKIQYEKTKFDGDNRVHFDIARKPPNERCTFCHASRHVGESAGTNKFVERDVHLSAGLSCADCHRNGMDHATIRGFNGEPAIDSDRYTCAGCHTGRQGGTLGAPKPVHAGIPPLHFEKISCTTCHSGPFPDPAGTRRLQTALAHALGVSTKERLDDALPHIYEPIFGRAATPKGPTMGYESFSAQYGPARAHWPSYWASSPEGQPLDPQIVRKAAARQLPKLKWQSFEQPGIDLSDELILAILVALRDAKIGQNPSYVRNGERIALTDDGALKRDFLGFARTPQLWPLAHPVRPAQAALGAKGCFECHADQATIFQGRALPASLTISDKERWHDWDMATFNGADRSLTRAWNKLFTMRSLGKAVLVIAVAIVMAALFSWLAARFSSAPNASADAKKRKVARRLAFGVTVTGAVVLGLTSLLTGRPSGWLLLIHSAANPIFIAGLTAWVVFWCRSCSGQASLSDWVICLTIFAGLGVMSTMLLAMLPLFSTDAMRDLLAWHKYFGIAVLVGLSAVILLSFLNRPART